MAPPGRSEALGIEPRVSEGPPVLSSNASLWQKGPTGREGQTTVARLRQSLPKVFLFELCSQPLLSDQKRRGAERGFTMVS